MNFLRQKWDYFYIIFLCDLKPDKGFLKLQRVEQFRIEHTMNTTSFFFFLSRNMRFESWKFFLWRLNPKRIPYFEKRGEWRAHVILVISGLTVALKEHQHHCSLLYTRKSPADEPIFPKSLSHGRSKCERFIKKQMMWKQNNKRYHQNNILLYFIVK